jgi:hypothetical protein
MSAQVDVQLKDFSTIFSLEGKVAVVTGGSRGLGLHAASGYVTLAVYQNLAVCGFLFLTRSIEHSAHLAKSSFLML